MQSFETVLAEDGSIYVHCDWRVVSHLKVILDDIFGVNNFVREIIEDILKRKADEKDFHNEEDDEEIEDLFEHLLPSKDSEAYREVSFINIFARVFLNVKHFRIMFSRAAPQFVLT